MTEETKTNIVNVKASSIPFKCVVCNGFGTVSNQRIQCRACLGKGYLLIPAEEDKNVK